MARRVCGLPHGAWSEFLVIACVPSSSRVVWQVQSRVELQYRYRRARCSTRQQLSSVCLVRTAPECAAACGGLRRLGRRRQTRHRSSRRRSARRRHLPSSHAIDAPRGVRVGGIQRCNPPALCMRVGTRCRRMHCMRPGALVRLSGCAFGKCGTGTHAPVCVVRYHTQQTTSSHPLVTPELPTG